VLCPNCATNLPDGSRYCLTCGRLLDASPEAGVPTASAAKHLKQRRGRNRSSQALAAILLAGLVAGLAWVATSSHSLAQQLREFAGSHTQAVGETAFSVKPHSFSSYKFDVPPGATNVVLNGQFTASGSPENNIEVYVLGDDDFVTLKSGYAANNYYDSGKITQGNINATLPFGGGAYYLVFDNRFSSRTPKAIHAAVTVHYQNLWPESILRLREKILDALGL